METSTDQTATERRKFYVIEYPGIVKNSSRAIATLGGIDACSTNFIKNRCLNLCYHPQNAYAKGTTSELRLTIGFVLRVRRRKSTREIIDSEFIGDVKAVHEFTKMYDAEILPMVQVPSASGDATPVFQSILDSLNPETISAAADWFDGGDPALTIGPFFPAFVLSRFQKPNNLALVKNDHPAAGLSGPESNHTEKTTVGKSVRKERKSTALMISHADKEFPVDPTPEGLERANKLSAELHSKIRNLFQERPMWHRSAIMLKTGVTDHCLKMIMPAHAFYIQNGPFGRLWCRFGFDPRISNAYKKYQVIAMTFKKLGNQLGIKSKMSEETRLRITSGYSSFSGAYDDRRRAAYKAGETETISESSYIFRPSVAPPFRAMFYMLEDIELPLAKIMIDEVTPEGTVCHPQHGFFRPSQLEKLRLSMKDALAENLAFQEESTNESDELMSDKA